MNCRPDRLVVTSPPYLDVTNFEKTNGCGYGSSAARIIHTRTTVA